MKDSLIRVLHVTPSMNRGGIETWLMNILRRLDRSRFRFEFLTRDLPEFHYEAEILALGGRIHRCSHSVWSPAFASELHRISAAHGPFAVVHAHVYSCGQITRLAEREAIPVRIGHSHNDNFSLATAGPGHRLVANQVRKAMLALSRRWLHRYATHGVACSDAAARALFGCQWNRDQRWSILMYGVDLKGFESGEDAAAVRREMNLPPDAMIIGSVGRFEHQKNHAFLVATFREIAAREPRAWLLLVGEGVLQERVRAALDQAGLGHRVVFTGSRPDVPRIMLGAMDAHVFPSLWEGLGLAHVEAQAAGLPCFASERLPPEADVVPQLVRRLPLSTGPAAWAEAILADVRQGPRLDRASALAAVRASDFNLDASLDRLTRLYLSAPAPLPR